MSPSHSPQQPRGSPNLSVATNVVSPRPMLSPKQSFARDLVTNTTLSRSDRVKTLERMAAEAVETNCNMSTSVPELVGLDLHVGNKDKTLPGPPIPSQKPKVESTPGTRPRVQAVFASTSPPRMGEPSQVTPRTPTIAAVTSLKVPRTIEDTKGGVSGLDALEARLLAEVGTRKMETNDQKPDIRSVLPIAIPRPIPVAQEPVNDSAISSLTLPGVGGEDTSGMAEKAKSVHSGDLHDGEVTERGRRSYRGRDDERISNGVKGERRGEKKSGKRIKDRPHEQTDGEMQQLRKAAQGRIAAWLGAIQPSASPLNSTSPSPARSPVPDRIRNEEPPISSEPTIHPFEDKDIEIENPVDARPNPRSSGFVPVETIRANQAKTSPVSPPKPPAKEAPTSRPPGPPGAQIGKLPHLGVFSPGIRPDPGVRYDVRSARGGRGGKVTEVAAIWASAAEADGSSNAATSPKPLPSKTRQPFKVPTKEPAKRVGLPSTSNDIRPTPKPKKSSSKEDMTMTSSEVTPAVNMNTNANLVSKRARMIKSSSVPAILSSSLATPMLSSTASLARPPASRVKERTKLDTKVSQFPGAGVMRSIPEDTKSETTPPPPPPKSPEPKGELAFGQARLRELIKRYQGPSSS